MNSTKTEIGIVGFGKFGQLSAKVLKEYFTITVYDIRDVLNATERIGVTNALSLEEVAKKDIVIIAVPVSNFEDTIKEVSQYVKEGALIIDVSSVKVKTKKLMHEYLPSNVVSIPTHPLFGPQSINDDGTVDGLRIVVACEDKCEDERVLDVLNFLREKLGLKVLIKSCQDHDKEMAYVQAITHFIGRALNNMEIPDSDQATKSYLALKDSAWYVKDDSEELFMTIQKENPYAQKTRKELIETLEELERMINN